MPTCISENGMFLDEDGDDNTVHSGRFEFRRPAPDPDGERWRNLLAKLRALHNGSHYAQVFEDGSGRIVEPRTTERIADWDTIEELDAYLFEPQPGPWVPADKVDWVGPAEAVMSPDGDPSVARMWIVSGQQYLIRTGDVFPIGNWRYYRKPATTTDIIWTTIQQKAEAYERLKQPLVVPGIPPTLVIPEGQESLTQTLDTGEKITVTRPQPGGAQ